MVTKIPNIKSKIIHFLRMAKIGYTEDDPIPLCLQENAIGLWELFATISPANVPTLFATYSVTGTPTGTLYPIPLDMHTRLVPAISYCNLMVGEQQANYHDPTQ